MRIIVTGAGGMLAQAVVAAGRVAGHDVIALDRRALDVTCAHDVSNVICAAHPDAVIHCAAYTRVDDAEDDAECAHLVNATATASVAAAANAADALLVYPSTDYVFDGSSSVPYSPRDDASPLNEYGRSKLAGEIAARGARRHHVVRTSGLYGSAGRNFVSTVLSRARAGDALRVVDDQRSAPTCTNDLAGMILALIERDAPNGVYHATNAGDATWFEFAQAVVDVAGIAADIAPISTRAYAQRAARPAYSVLDCTATYAITGDAPHWHDALTRAVPQLA